MSAETTVNIPERAHQTGIISLEQLRECWDELASSRPAPEDVLRLLQRKGYLTPYQIDRIQKGEKTGFFYGSAKILYKIASGGFARVYRGVNTQTGESVAVKVLRQRWASDKVCLEAFYHEGRVGQMLRHPNIVRIDEVAGHDSTHYITMEFVEGGSLKNLLEIRGGRIARDEAIRLMIDALGGFAYAWDQGVAHRDMKVTNLLASTQGTVKLADFGLASVHKDERKAEEAHGQRTVEYALLERSTGVEKGDRRSDIFFLGAVFYQMVTGNPPIAEKKDRISRMLRSRIDNIRPVREAYPLADAPLAAVIDRMMALEVKQRYQTPQEVIDALRLLTASAARTPDGRAAAADAAPADERKPAAPRGATRSVLFVEADTGLQDAVREKLHAIGYRVLITTDPQRAIERYREQLPNCVFVDCETTGKRGFEAFLEMAKVAETHRHPWAGVLMLTAEQSGWGEELTQSDNTVVLVKPVTLRQVREHLVRMAPVGA